MKKEYTKKNADSKPASMIVLDIFAQKILDGEYRSGDRLKETLLAVEFGVSRNAVRKRSVIPIKVWFQPQLKGTAQ